MQALKSRLAFLASEEAKAAKLIQRARQRTEAALAQRAQQQADQQVAATAVEALEKLRGRDGGTKPRSRPGSARPLTAGRTSLGAGLALDPSSTCSAQGWLEPASSSGMSASPRGSTADSQTWGTVCIPTVPTAKGAGSTPTSATWHHQQTPAQRTVAPAPLEQGNNTTSSSPTTAQHASRMVSSMIATCDAGSQAITGTEADVPVMSIVSATGWGAASATLHDLHSSDNACPPSVTALVLPRPDTEAEMLRRARLRQAREAFQLGHRPLVEQRGAATIFELGSGAWAL